MSSQKRKPFGEAPRDISNRSTNPVKNAMVKSLSGIPTTRAGPPLAIRTKTKSSTAINNETNDKSRQYKAQAYSDKITIASQTQRIEALQAELEQVRMFANTEKQAASHTSEQSVQDEELIEVLAQELQSTEADLKVAQSRVCELESDLKSERNRNSSSKSVGTVSTFTASTDTTEVGRLNKIIDSQRREIEKNKLDAREGVEIMRDLEKALRVARSDKNASVAARDEALKSVEGYKRQMEVMQLELTQHKEKSALAEKSQQENKEEYSALLARYSNLETSLMELQNVLTLVQSRSEKKAVAMAQALSEAEEREEKSALEYQTLKKKYNEVQSQCSEMESVLTDLTVRFEEMKAEVAKQEDELEMAEARHETRAEEMKQQYEEQLEIKTSDMKEEARILYEAMLAENEKVHEAAVKEMKLKFEQQLMEKDNLLKAREKQWLAENRETEQDLSRHKTENTKLKSENIELTRKIERGITMYNEATSQLKAKTAEASAAASSNGTNAELFAANKALKRDLTSAVESSISRGKQIQALEKEIDSYQSQLAKLKRMKKDAPSTPTKSEDLETLGSEVTILRARAKEAENEKRMLEEKLATFIDIQTKSVKDERRQLQSEKEQLETDANQLRVKVKDMEEIISNMKKEMTSLSSKASKVEHLEKELDNAHHASEESKSRILNLEKALQETETVLRTVSTARLKGSTPTSSPGVIPSDCSENQMRRQIENNVLKEYIGERL